MDGKIRWVAFGALAVVVLGLIALLAPRTMPGAVDAPRKEAEVKERLKEAGTTCATNPYFRKSPLLSEWQALEASTPGLDARYSFNPFSMACDPATGHRDVWLQLEYGTPRTEDFEDETTIQSVTFTRERYLYRIDCGEQTFAVLERRIMGAAPDEVVREVALTPEDGPTLEPFRPGGVASVLAGPACSTGQF
jgi:hypothetical protein